MKEYIYPAKRIKQITVTDTTTLDGSYEVILCNKTTTMTVNLPTAANFKGKTFTIKNINIGVVTIDPYLSETIDGKTTFELSNQYLSRTVFSDGSNWHFIKGYTDGIWKDFILLVSGLGQGVTVPSLTTVVGNVQTYLFQTGDMLWGAFEIQHDYKEGTDLYAHVHWAPDSTNTGNAVFLFEYTVANINGNFLSPSVVITATQAASGVINRHQKVDFSPVISGSGRKIGDIISFRLFRTTTGNTFTGNCLMFSVGVHYECDSLGSNQINSKN
jgi:hypothetical protein